MPATVVEWQMRAWWSVLFVPKSRTHLHSRYDCSLLCLEEPIQKVASAPLSCLICSSFREISSYAASHETRLHLPPSSFTGVLRRRESWVTPCSRIDAPFAQCAPRLNGESNTGSWRTQTPFSTTASMAQPTEQCVHTVRFTSTFASAALACASALPIMLKGSWVANAPAPAATPVCFRKARRSIVFASAPERPRARRARDCEAAPEPAFLVSCMGTSSDLRGEVVVVHVRGRLVAARRALALIGYRRPGRRRIFHYDRGGGHAAGAYRQEEITARKMVRPLDHGCNTS